MQSSLSYFKISFILTGVGIAVGGLIGWLETGTIAGLVAGAFIVAVLGTMEISLSFDNSVVNAGILEHMNEKWRRYFLTWGIAIAVVGMRLVFPLAIVAVAAHISPWNAIDLAVTKPHEYAAVLSGAHYQIAAFGGAFLLMVALSYFLDEEKDVHWIGPAERLMSRMGNLDAVQIGITLLIIYIMSRLVGTHGAEFLTAGVLGAITFVAVKALGTLTASDVAGKAVRSGAAAFIYLEFLDASFSFDGVIGAFALSNNLFIITAGLGIGAAYVRSMTMLLVEKKTLATYAYLESGAFWAILILACIMLLQTIMHIPEVVTGLIGITVLGVAFFMSKQKNKRDTIEQLNQPALNGEIV